MNEWFLGNILLGGLIGIIVDASTGAMYKLTPEQVLAQMNKSPAQISSQKDKTYFSVTFKPDPT